MLTWETSCPTARRAYFSPLQRGRELEREVDDCRKYCRSLFVSMDTVEKDESVSRSYLSELQSIKSHLEEAEQRLMRGMQSPPSSNLSGDVGDNKVQIAEQELQQDLSGLRTNLDDVSRRCVSFFEEKPSSSSVPILRSELNLAVEQIDRLHSLSSVYLQKLKTVDVLMRSLQTAESLVRKHESRLSEEDSVPADTQAIQTLREQLQGWQRELSEQESVFEALSSEVQRARKAGHQLSQLHPDHSSELKRCQERAGQLSERWTGVCRQIETRQVELEALGSALQQYRESHSSLMRWIEESTKRQDNTHPGQTDSKALSEELAQQTALVAEIEWKQTKLDECQTHSKQYCTAVKDYDLQLMTFRAFVESTQKTPVKRRRMHSSSDTITQEFMDLRTRYTVLVTLTTQHVKYISNALRKLEEEEKEVKEERQAWVGQVTELLGLVKGIQEQARVIERSQDQDPKSSLAAQLAINEQLAAKKEEVAEAIRNTQQASMLSPEEQAQVNVHLEELTSTYNQLCNSSAQQVQQLVETLAKKEQHKAKAAEDLQETQGTINSLMKELTSLDQPDRKRSLGEMATDSASSPASQGSLQSHSGMLQALPSELAEQSGMVEELKSTLKKLMAENLDSPEVEAWKQQLRDIDNEKRDGGQVTELLEKIEEMVAGNRGCPFQLKLSKEFPPNFREHIPDDGSGGSSVSGSAASRPVSGSAISKLLRPFKHLNMAAPTQSSGYGTGGAAEEAAAGEMGAEIHTTTAHGDDRHKVNFVDLSTINVNYNNCIGRGSYGTVYKGSYLGTPAAVKVIPIGDSSVITNEFLIPLRLSHPHIVRMMAVAKSETQILIANEYIQGADLNKVIYKDTPIKFQYEDKLSVALEIAMAVEYIHGKWIIHQDLKPANIMISEGDRKAYLTDWGLANCKETISMTAGSGKTADYYGPMGGTPPYMAPECLVECEDCSTMSDMWSLGITLLEMFTDLRPWPSNDPKKIRKLLYDRQSPHALAKLQPALGNILKPLLKYEPRSRMNAKDLVELLKSKVDVNKRKK
ncbi:microtubule-actin cross-linking factor 1-like isoform X2 [Sardina pilchardus]|uniref:microtubule-actin cross-linking factor 1-like isoform X2 n=1 Tax=Sardina pilchardus TaxID=27697 RepID=UPI002E107ACB